MKSKLNNDSLYRLRIEDNIVGFLQQKGRYTFYSKDLYGWNGSSIEFEYKDISTQYLDKNRKVIFENDIIELTDQPEKYYIVTHDSLINKFYLVDFQTKRIFEKEFDEIFTQNRSFKRVSYTFRNK